MEGINRYEEAYMFTQDEVITIVILTLIMGFCIGNIFQILINIYRSE